MYLIGFLVAVEGPLGGVSDGQQVARAHPGMLVLVVQEKDVVLPRVPVWRARCRWPVLRLIWFSWQGKIGREKRIAALHRIASHRP
jgi:hypothetical protein